MKNQNFTSEKGSLAKDFGAPPFTTLDARQGYWRKRKEQWLSLGLQSELGRKENMLGLSASWQSLQKYNGRSQDKPPSWTKTSIFDPVLTECLYAWFCPDGGRVLDPFAGGSVRGIVASKMGLDYFGVELSKTQISANKKQAKRICKKSKHQPTWKNGDSINIDQYCTGKFNFLLTCPPYGHLEVYSDHPKDLSNMPVDQFKEAYHAIIQKSCEQLEEDSFAAIVVGEYRDKDGNYVGFVADTVQAFQDAGLKLYNDAVLQTSIGTAAIRARKIFTPSRKLCRTHQNVLIFVKGDGVRASAKLGDGKIKHDII